MFKIRKPISSEMAKSITLLSVVLLILFYWKISYDQHLLNPKDTTLPTFTQLFDGIKRICTPDSLGKIPLWEDSKATLSRHFLGLSLGVILSIILGLLSGCYAIVEAFFMPIFNFFSKIPTTAMMVVYFVLFGTDLNLFIAIVALGTMPILTQTICQSIQKDVPDHYIEKAYTLGGSSGEVIYNVCFKTILPRIIEAIRLQAGPALILLIAAEVLVADIGFGYRLRMQSRLLNMNVVIVYLIILGMFYVTIDSSLKFLRLKLCAWFGE
jgi:NitT/TauT family transport system permease protein